MAMRGILGSRRGRAIKELADALGDKGANLAGMDPGIHISSVIVARFIKVHDILETSSNTPYSTNTVRIIGRGNVASGIMNSPNTIKIPWG